MQVESAASSSMVSIDKLEKDEREKAVGQQRQAISDKDIEIQSLKQQLQQALESKAGTENNSRIPTDQQPNLHAIIQQKDKKLAELQHIIDQ